MTAKRAFPVSISAWSVCIGICLTAWTSDAFSLSMQAMPSPTNSKAAAITPAVLDRMRASLWGVYIGDALAMPTHWYYDQSNLKATYGTIKGYVKPKDKLRGSIMSLSNTGGGGRGSNSGNIVGDVILKGKKQYWERGADWFYHRGLEAGENTLEGIITRLITRSITANKGYNHDDILSKYIDLMTTPDAHNDTYAGTGHRMFFANYIKGKKPRECPDNDGHNTDAADGLVNLPPVVYFSMAEGGDAVDRHAVECVSLFRESKALRQYAPVMSALLVNLVQGASLRDSVTQTGKVMGVNIPAMVQRSSSDPMTACYLDSNVPSMLQLAHAAYKYAEDPKAGLLANTNTGGENVARGAFLGAVYGAGHGMKAWPQDLITGLTKHEEIGQEIEALMKLISEKAGVAPAEL